MEVMKEGRFAPERRSAFEGLGHLLRAALGLKEEESSYLRDNFAPVQLELEGEAVDVVDGTVPEAICGAYLRVGPNPKFRPRYGYHWFDGDGMVHVVRIKRDGMLYSNRFVRTVKLGVEENVGREYYQKLGHMKGLFGLGTSVALKASELLGLYPGEKQSAGTANTALLYHAKRVLALHEGDVPYALRVLCNGIVETIGALTDLHEHVHTFTAHPKVDNETGDVTFLSYDMMAAPYASVGFMDAKGGLDRVVPISGVKRPVMMHDFAVTEHYAVIFDNPLVFEAAALTSRNGFPLQIHRDLPTRFGILPRSARTDEDIRWVEVEGGCWVIHTANAWEEPSTGLIHLVTNRTTDIDMETYSPVDGSESFFCLVKWELDPESGTGSSRPLLPKRFNVEFPVINEAYSGKRNRYCWAAVCESWEGGPKLGGIVKVDLAAEPGELERSVAGELRYGDGCYGGEMSFVPRYTDPSRCDGEDDGYLVGYVRNETEQQSYFEVYDAKSMSPQPVCRAKIPGRVPYGFHGRHLSEDAFQAQLHASARGTARPK